MLNKEEQGEIRTMYRQAAQPRRQIAILAQLYAVPKEEILEALGLAELPQEERRAAKQPKTNRRKWPEEVHRAVVGQVLAGKTHVQAGAAFGVPQNTVTGWMFTWRREQRRNSQ